MPLFSTNPGFVFEQAHYKLSYKRPLLLAAERLPLQLGFKEGLQCIPFQSWTTAK